MRSIMRKLVLVAVVAAGSSGIHGASAHADVGFYSNGASATGQSSGRGRSAGFFGPRTVYQLPAPNPTATAGYWYYPPQPVYQLPAPNPTATTGYWYYSPQPIYQLPAPNPAATAGYWYHSPQPVYQLPASNPAATTGY
jgi:hypothetical protein